jgi:2'-5' RNA ligase
LTYPQEKNIKGTLIYGGLVVEISFAPSFSAFPPAVQGLSRLKTRRQQRVHDQLAQLALPRWRQLIAAAPLFLAVVPPAKVAARIARLTRHLKVGHELTGKPLLPEHLRVTLCRLEETDADAALATAEALAMPAFKVAFDRVGSFSNGAVVLRGDEDLIGLEILQQRLSDSLDGRPQRARAFSPHITVLRGCQSVPDHDIEPIEWEVREIVLVHGLPGKSSHRQLARVPLA